MPTHRPETPRDSRRLILIGLVTGAVYVLTARLGFRVAFTAEQITTVWAPTGIAIAALMLWGRSLWPAIWLAAFVVNLDTQAPWWAAAGIASGNTLEAVAAVWALRRLGDFDPALSRVSDVVALLAVAAVSTAITAMTGVTILAVAGVQPWSRFSELWFDWWLGDALGALVIAPAILTTARARAPWLRRDVVEICLFVVAAALLTELVFGRVFGPLIGLHPLEYVIFCFVIFAAMRRRQPTTALVVLAVSAVTIWNTVHGAGPFAGTPVHQGLILLQVFMGVLAGTGLLLAAAIEERATSERRRAAAYAVGEVLMGPADLAHAAPAILRSLCENLQWQLGALWIVDPAAHRLRALSVWPAERARTEEFVAVTEDTLFPAGVGLPGRVWRSGEAAWIEDVVHDSNFPRAAVARSAGVHGAFAFPIRLDDDVLGVIECFTYAVAAPDSGLLRTMTTVGNQIGQFIGRKRGVVAIEEGERRTGAILDSALDAIIGIDHLGVITEFNPAAERTFGYSRTQAVGQELAGLVIPAELRRRHRDGLTRYLATGEGPFIGRRIDTTAHHADGHEFPVEVSITRIPGEDPPRFTGFVRDVTARVQSEQERERLLQRESAARRDAETANRAKDDFLATLSHELRTPLNAIVGWTRMLLDGTMDERSTTHALEVIDRNAHLQVRLVSDILDVSRIITGGLKLDVRPVDLGSVIGAALDSVRPAADAKKIQIRSRLTASARLANGDPQRLQQIVWNLLANAVKFTPAGGTVDVNLLDAGIDGVRIRISDDGPGIDPDFLPHVFERFRQADGSVSRQHGGLGLGLAIVRHLVELHGGEVRAESPGPGKGATFTVQLPRIDSGRAITQLSQPEKTAGGSPSSQAAPLADCRALVVDDEQDSRELIAMILSAAGAIVETASSADEALAHLDTSWPDVLLADIGMPGTDGYGLMREVRDRQAQGHPHLSAVAVTAYAGNLDRERVLLAGFDHHISKPVDPSTIVQTVVSLRQAHGHS
jgi:PAS domain S-box-containing protein